MGPLITINLDGTARQVHDDLWRIWLLPGEPEPGVVIRVPIDPDAAVRWEELDRLPGLTEIHYTGGDPRVQSYLAGRPGVSRFVWSQHRQQRLDFSHTELRELSFETGAEPLEVILPESGSLTRLAFAAPPAPGLLRVEAPEQGRGIYLMVGCQASPEGSDAVPGLERITALSLFNVRHARLERLLGYTELEELSVTGPPGGIPDLGPLAQFPCLRKLTLRDCYELGAQTLPAGDAFPALETVEIDGIRQEDAALFTERLAGLRKLAIRGKRTDAWLRANLANPFREWPDEHGATVGRAAMSAYRKAVAGLERAGAAGDAEAAREVLRSFVESLNRQSARQAFDTIQREEVADAYDELTCQVSLLIPAATAGEWFEEWEEL